MGLVIFSFVYNWKVDSRTQSNDVLCLLTLTLRCTEFVACLCFYLGMHDTAFACVIRTFPF